MGETLFALANIGVLTGASILGYRVWRGGAPSNSCWLLTTAAVFVILCHTAMLGLGIAGLLDPAAAAAFGLTVAVAAMAWNRRVRLRGGDAPRARDAGQAPPPGPADWVACLALAIVGSSLFLTEVWRAGGFEMWDDFTYHMAISAGWLVERSLLTHDAGNIYTYHYFYPCSGDLVATWFLLPFGPTDRAEALAWVGTTGFMYWVMATLAAAEALRRLGAPLSLRLLPGILLGASPRIALLTWSFADVDLGLAAVVLSALTFAVPTPGDRGDRRGVRAETWIAGLLCGLAVGYKVTGVLGAAVILPLCVVREARACGRARAFGEFSILARSAVRVLVIFVVAGLGTGAFWYLRNVALTGNPLFPAKILGWDGLDFRNTRLTEFAAAYGLKTTIRDAVRHFGDWPDRLGLLAAVGFLALGIAALRRIPSEGPPGGRFWTAGSLGIALVTVVVFPTLPFSAGNEATFVVREIHGMSFRYVAILPILGWTSLAAGLTLLLRSASAAGQVSTGLVAIALLSFRPWNAPFYAGEWVLVASVLGALVLTAVAAMLGRRGAPAAGGGRVPRLALASVVAVAVLVPVCLGLRHKEKARMVEAMIDTNPYGGGVWQHLDRIPEPLRVAAFGRKFTFPLFGRGFRHRPIGTDETGALYETPRRHIDESAFRPPSDDLAERLIDSGVDTVLVLRVEHVGEQYGWPSQKEILDRSGIARAVYQDDHAVLYRLDEGAIARRRPGAIVR